MYYLCYMFTIKIFHPKFYRKMFKLPHRAQMLLQGWWNIMDPFTVFTPSYHSFMVFSTAYILFCITWISTISISAYSMFAYIYWTRVRDSFLKVLVWGQIIKPLKLAEFTWKNPSFWWNSKSVYFVFLMCFRKLFLHNYRFVRFRVLTKPEVFKS